MMRRAGATLVEVLVAIFVTAIGLLSLLALFPLGALTMAQAIRDDRAALAAANAEQVRQIMIPQNDPSLLTANNTPLFIDPSGIPGWVANQADPTLALLVELQPLLRGVASYPVYMDPIGFQSYAGSLMTANTLGFNPITNSGPYIRRVTPSAVARASFKAQYTLSWFTVPDDMPFMKDVSYPGLTTVPGAAANVQREGLYSVAFLFQLPPGFIATTLPNVQRVVYRQRPLGLNSGTLGTPLPSGEASYSQCTGAANTNRLTFIWNPLLGEDKPALRRGSWILDATTEQIGIPNPNGGPPLHYGWAHGQFYRVVGITETGPNSLDLELQQNLIRDIIPVTPSPKNYQTTITPWIIVLDNVIEVL